GKSYVSIGGVSMGIMGSFLDPDFMQKYLGIRSEWVDMSEVIRRLQLGIYDGAEYEKALAWAKANCTEGTDFNPDAKSREEKDADWETCVKMTLICKDIVSGNPKLAEMGYVEEAGGRNGIAGGFQGQRQWTDFMPNADFTEAIMNSSFDWNGKRQPTIFATENDNLNAISMLFTHLMNGQAAVFADVRTYWSADSVKRVTGNELTGKAANGIIHLINSGAAALDGAGVQKTAAGEPTMKPWWDVTEGDVSACLEATTWYPANLQYFRGGGYSSNFTTKAEMPLTMVRLNLVDGLGPVLQIAEGYSCHLPDDMHKTLNDRTDKTWPTTWFAPTLTGEGAFTDVYSVMANWGANHSSFCYGHVGADLITLASMLRIPVSMHNVADEKVYRPHAWAAFGTKDAEGADYRACGNYGELYK
ncbi:MAG: L-fucose isomerase, partial [Oscillospiraceae bacterium]|nr:L-fucose isomerase [Oscillospiraceae bacterium]